MPALSTGSGAYGWFLVCTNSLRKRACVAHAAYGKILQIKRPPGTTQAFPDRPLYALVVAYCYDSDQVIVEVDPSDFVSRPWGRNHAAVGIVWLEDYPYQQSRLYYLDLDGLLHFNPTLSDMYR